MSGASFFMDSYWSKSVVAKTAYSSAMAGLAWWQSVSPEYAGQIVRIQRIALILDIICWVSDLYDIERELHQQVSYPPKVKEKQWYHSPIKASLAFIVGVIAIPLIVTPVSVSCINRYAKPNLDVATLFKGMGVLSEATDCRVGWSVPKIQKISQWILLNRVVANGVLTTISKKRAFYLASSLLQIFSLSSISKLCWLKVEKPIHELLVSVMEGKREASTLKGNVVFEFFIPPLKPENALGSKCLSAASHMQARIQGIYDYMAACLTNRQLKSRWDESRFKGYELWVPAPQLPPCHCGGQTFLDRATGTGAHSTMGTVRIRVIRSPNMSLFLGSGINTNLKS